MSEFPYMIIGDYMFVKGDFPASDFVPFSIITGEEQTTPLTEDDFEKVADFYDVGNYQYVPDEELAKDYTTCTGFFLIRLNGTGSGTLSMTGYSKIYTLNIEYNGTTLTVNNNTTDSNLFITVCGYNKIPTKEYSELTYFVGNTEDEISYTTTPDFDTTTYEPGRLYWERTDGNLEIELFNVYFMNYDTDVSVFDTKGVFFNYDSINTNYISIPNYNFPDQPFKLVKYIMGADSVEIGDVGNIYYDESNNGLFTDITLTNGNIENVNLTQKIIDVLSTSDLYHNETINNIGLINSNFRIQKENIILYNNNYTIPENIIINSYNEILKNKYQCFYIKNNDKEFTFQVISREKQPEININTQQAINGNIEYEILGKSTNKWNFELYADTMEKIQFLDDITNNPLCEVKFDEIGEEYKQCIITSLTYNRITVFKYNVSLELVIL